MTTHGIPWWIPTHGVAGQNTRTRGTGYPFMGCQNLIPVHRVPEWETRAWSPRTPTYQKELQKLLAFQRNLMADLTPTLQFHTFASMSVELGNLKGGRGGKGVEDWGQRWLRVNEWRDNNRLWCGVWEVTENFTILCLYFPCLLVLSSIMLAQIYVVLLWKFLFSFLVLVWNWARRHQHWKSGEQKQR